MTQLDSNPQIRITLPQRHHGVADAARGEDDGDEPHRDHERPEDVRAVDVAPALLRSSHGHSLAGQTSASGSPLAC